MKRSRWLVVFAVVILVVVAAVLYGLPRFNGYQKSGSLVLSGLSEPVTVIRDEKGMPYISARNLSDAILAQGFVTAQDRLFQMQLTRLLAEGRISELVGDRGKPLDIMMRTIGIHRNAKRHAAMLDEKARGFLQRYVDGVNAFISTRPQSRPVEFHLAGIEPEPWSVSDSLAIVYYMGWITSANVKAEIIAQMLVEKVGLERARSLFPRAVNPDDPADDRKRTAIADAETAPLGFGADTLILPYCHALGNGFGSNNWAVSPRLSPNGKPLVANDPHLDARILPGIWYSSAIITPQLRGVGVMVPGIPGMVIGRTNHFAMGVTNAYGDCQDLYVETLDPEDPTKYMEGDQSLPFKVIEETLRIKDENAPGGQRAESVKIRLTKRGPVVSGLLPELRTDKVISLRWAAAETMGPNIGLTELLTAKSVSEVRSALKDLNLIVLNCVFADVQGNIGWHVSGKLPIRSQGDSTVPYVVKDGTDNWIGWIPFDQMPHDQNPGKGWLGTCNHKTITSSYPYYFTSYFAPSYRYRRLKQLLSRSTPPSVDEHWQFQRDTKNLMAVELGPVMSQALLAHEDTKVLGQILAEWNYRDDRDQAAPTIFQLVYRDFCRLAFRDELGDDLTAILLNEGYFWQERLQDMVLDGASPWFDNVVTKDKRETMNELFHQAALESAKELATRLGTEPRGWKWGAAHKILFVNPLRRTGLGTSLLGSGPYPMGGSRETLYCAWYDYDKPFSVILSASLRMVADLGDDEKVLAVLPGGVSGRTFDPHMRDQVEPYMRGDKVYWWFSDDAIRGHGTTTLTLQPK